MLQSFLLALVGVAAAQASPGPNMFAVIGAALGNGRRAALLVVAGIASGTLVWAAFAALGLGAVFTAVPALLTALKFIGGAYLCYIGFRGLRAVLRGTEATLRPETRTLSDSAAWRRGFFVVMTTAPILWRLSRFTASASVSGSGRVWTTTPLVCRMVSTSILKSSSIRL